MEAAGLEEVSASGLDDGDGVDSSTAGLVRVLRPTEYLSNDEISSLHEDENDKLLNVGLCP